MNRTKSQQRWLWIGSSASIVSALMTGLALVSHFQQSTNGVFLRHFIDRNELLFTMLYAMSLMVVPFALWHRIEDHNRKWTARVCNGLTTSTAIWASLTYVTVMVRTLTIHHTPGAGAILNGLFLVGSIGTIISMSTCMGFMGWSLWRGKSKWFGLAAVFLAVAPFLHISPTFPEWVRVFWLLWLARWFVEPLHKGTKCASAR